MRIVPLFEAPSARPVLARWFAEAWPGWYGPSGGGDADADLAAASAGVDRLPVGLVAVDDDGEVLGTATLRNEGAGADRGAGPWLGGLLVGAPYRGQGIAVALVQAIEAEASRLGFTAIYCAVAPARTLFRRCGWEFAGTAGSFGQPLAVYRRQLVEAADGD